MSRKISKITANRFAIALGYARPVGCAACETPAMPGADFCKRCQAKRRVEDTAEGTRATGRGGRQIVRLIVRFAVLIAAVLGFAVIVGVVCPRPFQPLLLLAGIVAGFTIAITILGGESENA